VTGAAAGLQAAARQAAATDCFTFDQHSYEHNHVVQASQQLHYVQELVVERDCDAFACTQGAGSCRTAGPGQKAAQQEE
jgi:hypothetical protein